MNLLRAGLWLTVSFAFFQVQGRASQVTRFPGEDRGLIQAIVRGDAPTVATHIAADPGAAVRLLGDGGRKNGFRPRETALSIAVRNHRMVLARMLLEAGADPGRKQGLNEGILANAQFPEMIELLMKHGAEPEALAGVLPVGHLSAGFDWTPRVRSNYRALMDLGIAVAELTKARFGWLDDIHVSGTIGPEQTRVSHKLLYYAIERRDLGLLGALLAAGAPVEGAPPTDGYSPWWYPETLVQWALATGSADYVLTVLGAGAPIDPDATGWDAFSHGRPLDPSEYLAEDGDLLDRAIDLGSVEVFDRLTNTAFDPTCSRVLQGTSHNVLRSRMMRAAWRGHAEVLERLFAKAEQYEFAVPLADLQLAAAAGGHRALVQGLRERSGLLSPHAAAICNMAALRAMVAADGSLLRMRDPICGVTPLGWAVLLGREEAVKELVELGSDVDATIDSRIAGASWRPLPGTRMPVPAGDDPSPWFGQGGRTVSLLLAALSRQKLGIASTLVAARAKVYPRALTLMARETGPESSGLLTKVLERGIVIKREAGWAQGALLALLASGRSDAGELIDQIFAQGGTRSLRARGAESMVDDGFRLGASQDLLRRLVDEGSEASDGTMAALGWCRASKAQQIVDRLGANEWQSLLTTCSRRSGTGAYRRVFELRSAVTHEEAVMQVRELAHRGRLDLIRIAALRCRDDYDPFTDPHVLLNGVANPRFLRDVLALGADPNSGEPGAFGPLHAAAREGALDSVRLLLEAGADPGARSYNGRAPLYEVTFAARSMRSQAEEPRVLAVIEALLEAGADPLSVTDVGAVTYEQLQYQDWSPEGAADLRDLLAGHVDPDWL